MEMKYGVEFKNSILRQLQVDPRFFENPDSIMNIRMMRDLCNILHNLGFTTKDFINMGLMSFQVNKNSYMGEHYGSYRNFEELMDDLCNGLSSNYDQNYDYFITKKERNSISIGSKPTEKILEYLGPDEVGSDQICLTKLGVLGSLPKYLKYEFSNAEKTKCMREGSSYHEYKINFFK